MIGQTIKIKKNVSMFSLLNFGKYIQCVLYPWNGRISQMVFFLIQMGLGIVMAAQIYVSVLKLDSKPTGTSVEYKEMNQVINMSLTACKLDHDMQDTDVHIQPLLYVGSKNRDKFIDEFIGDVDNNTISPFYWFDNDFIHICKTIDLHQAEATKIIHSYGFGRGTDPRNMKLYIHETGLFGSGYEVKFQTEWYEGNTVVLLDLEQIVNIPDPSMCNQDYLFDQCKQRYISEEFKTVTGCSLKLPRFVNINA